MTDNVFTGKTYRATCGATVKIIAKHALNEDEFIGEKPNGKLKSFHKSDLIEEVADKYVGVGLCCETNALKLTDDKADKRHAENSWNKHHNGTFLYVAKLTPNGAETV